MPIPLGTRGERSGGALSPLAHRALAHLARVGASSAQPVSNAAANLRPLWTDHARNMLEES